jgi:hypothetical protein
LSVIAADTGKWIFAACDVAVDKRPFVCESESYRGARDKPARYGIEANVLARHGAGQARALRD